MLHLGNLAFSGTPIPPYPQPATNLTNRQDFPPPPLSGFGEADILLTEPVVEMP